MSRKCPALVVAVAVVLILPAQAVAAGFGKRTLHVGMSGPDVRVLQRYLDRVGIDTTADGQFGTSTRRSVQAFEREQDRGVDGIVTRSDARALKRMVASGASTAGSDFGGTSVSDDPADAPVAEGPGAQATLSASGLAVAPASAPPEIKAVIAAGNKIAKKPYKYGGGHGRWVDTGYDCSGSVSYALHAAGLLSNSLDSSGFMRWGQHGRGSWITIRSNPGHAYMIVAGLRFDTSAAKAGGSRWTDQMRSARGYRGTHPAGF